MTTELNYCNAAFVLHFYFFFSASYSFRVSCISTLIPWNKRMQPVTIGCCLSTKQQVDFNLLCYFLKSVTGRQYHIIRSPFCVTHLNTLFVLILSIFLRFPLFFLQHPVFCCCAHVEKVLFFWVFLVYLEILRGKHFSQYTT